jgi:CDGSH-type Zn-finger protein
MARLIRHSNIGPYKVDPSTFPPGKMIFICGCGLSQNLPFCDGSHKNGCQNEEAAKLYIYDADRKAVVEVTADKQAASANPAAEM